MISIIFCGDIKYCPYLERYTDRLDEYEIDYHVVFWNRSGDSLNYPANYYWFEKQSALDNNKFVKALDFISFRVWLNKYLRTIKPEKCILLSTLSGMIIADRLMIKGTPYLMDIRDYSYERFFPYYLYEKFVIKNSFKTVISSKGFEAFLPEYDYVIAHNFNRDDLIDLSERAKTNKPICILWNGVMRFFDYQKNIIDVFKNDDRFQFIYYGDGPELESYVDYCRNNNIKNVVFKGKYDNANKASIMMEADILNNCYGYNNYTGDKLKYAISNRFYDGLIYKKPQLVEHNGFKTSLVVNNNLGWALEDDISDLPDRLFYNYSNMNFERFEKSCDKVLSSVISDDDRYIDTIDLFITSV